MATITLDDVTIELMQANVTLEKIDSNTALTNEFLNLSVDTFKKGFGDLLEFFKGSSLANLEREREQAEFNKDMLAALQDLKPEYTGPNKASIPKDADFGLGGLLTGLAIAIGAVIGVIKGQIGAIKTVISALHKAAKAIASIVPDFIKNFFSKFMPTDLIQSVRKSIATFAAGLSMQFDLAKAAISDKLKTVSKFVSGVFNDVMRFFSGESKLFSGLKAAFNTIVEPFKNAFKVITELFAPVQKVGGFFSEMAAKLGQFSGIIGKTVNIVADIFKPIGIIFAVWDTVKGAIEGYNKDGIIGGIGGAVKGLFNSLIFGPADMLKDATAWVLGFFGFDKAKEFLKSFSFEKTFSTIIDAITSPIDTLKNLMNGVVDFFTDIGKKITGFFTDFEIPGFSILGKKFGPWKPFGQAKTEETPAPTAAPPAPASKGAVNTAAAKTGGTPTLRVASAEDAKIYDEAYQKARSDGAGVMEARRMATEHVQAVRARKAAEAGTSGQQPALSSPATKSPAVVPTIQTAQAPATKSPAVVPTIQTAQAPVSGGTTPGVGAVPSAAGNMSKGEESKLYIDAYERARVDGASVNEAKIIAREHVEAVRARKAMELGTPTTPGMAVQSGQNLQTVGQENGMLAAAPARGGNGSGAGGGNVNQNNSTTVVNNSTVVVKPIPSATRRPNNSEDIFFRGAAAGYAY